MLLDDCRANYVGGIQAGIDLWEAVVIPICLNNADTWIGIESDSINKFKNLQLMMTRYLLDAKKTTPSLALWWDCDLIQIHIRIDMMKLKLAHHITDLDDGSLACDILMEQQKLMLPGLAQEVDEISRKYNLPNIIKSKHNHSKFSWKIMVKKAAIVRCSDMFKTGATKLSKLKDSELV